MANKFVVTIEESLDEIKQRLKQQTTATGKERMQMLYWLKQEDIQTRQALAKRLHRDEATVYRWLKRYKEKGIDGLLEVKIPPGVDPKIEGAILEDLKAQLKRAEGFASYRAIQQWLSEVHQLEVPYSTVHRTVRYRLKAKLKVPRPRSAKADEHQQEQYKKSCPS